MPKWFRQLGRYFRGRRWQWLLLALLLPIAAVVFTWRYLTSERFILSRAHQALVDITGAQVEIEHARLGLNGRLELTDVRCLAPELADSPAGEFLHVGKLIVQLDTAALWTGRILPNRVRLVEPVMTVCEDPARGLINVALVDWPTDPDAAPPERVPSVVIEQGTFRHAEVRDGQLEVLGSLQLVGQLDRPDPALPSYDLRLNQVADEFVHDVDQRIRITGSINPAAASGRIDIRGLRFAEHLRRLLPQTLRQTWDRFEPGGNLTLVSLSFNEQTGPVLSIDIEHVALTMPRLTDDPYRFRMTDSQGRLVFDHSGIAIEQLQGQIEQIGYRIDGKIADYDARAPFNVAVRTDVFEVPEQPRFIFALPAPVQKLFRTLTPVGTLSATTRIWRNSANDPIDYDGAVTIESGRGHYHKFPYELTDCRGLIVFNREAVEVKQLTGRAADKGTVTVTGTVTPPGDEAEVDITVTAVNLPFDQRLYEAFQDRHKVALDMFFHRPSYQRLLEHGHFLTSEQRAVAEAEAENLRYQHMLLDDNDHAQRLALSLRRSRIDPRLELSEFDLGGRADVIVHAYRPPGPDRRYVIRTEVELREANICFQYFPYPLRVNSGRFVIEPGVVKFDGIKAEGLRGGYGGLSGHILMPTESIPERRRVLPELRVFAIEMPLDELLYDALPQSQADWVRELHAEGRIDIVGDIFANVEQKTDVNLLIRTEDVSARPGNGPLELENVNSRLRVSLGRLDVESLRASHGDGELVMTGKAMWDQPGEPEIDLRLAVEKLNFEDPLLEYVAPFVEVNEDFKTFYEKRQPAGPFDAAVDFHQRSDGDRDYMIELRPRALAFNQDETRVDVHQMQGTVIIEPHQLRLDQVSGLLGENDVAIDGSIALHPRLKADIGLKATGGQITSELQQVMPGTVKRLVAALGFQGAYTLDLPNVEWYRDDQQKDIYSVRGHLDIRGGQCAVGVPVTELHGRAQIEMQQRPGEAWPDIQLAMRANSMRVLDRPITDFIANAQRVEGTDQLVIPVMRGACCGGTIGGKGTLGLSDRSYRFRLALTNVELAELMRNTQTAEDADNATDDEQPVSGVVAASLDIQGVWDRPDQRRGRGDIQIRDAVLYDLPIAMGLLQITHLSLPVTRSFDQALISYYVQDQLVTFERLLLASDTMQLSGRGTMKYDTQALDLTLTSSNPGGLKLGPVTDLIDSVRDQLVTIRVTGTLTEPETRVQQLSGLAKAWQDVFGESTSESERSP